MRRLVLATLVAALMVLGLGWSVALATEPKPEVIEEADLLRVQLASARVELATRALEDAKRAAEEAVKGLRSRYHLEETDSIDPATRQIKRAPKPGKK